MSNLLHATLGDYSLAGIYDPRYDSTPIVCSSPILPRVVRPSARRRNATNALGGGAEPVGGTTHRAKRGPPVQIFHASPYELSVGGLRPPRPPRGGRGGETPTVRLRRRSAAARHLRSGGRARRRRKRGLRPPQDLPPRIGGVGGASPPTTTNSASGPPSTSPCSSTAPPPHPRFSPSISLLRVASARSPAKGRKAARFPIPHRLFGAKRPAAQPQRKMPPFSAFRGGGNARGGGSPHRAWAATPPHLRGPFIEFYPVYPALSLSKKERKCGHPKSPPHAPTPPRGGRGGNPHHRAPRQTVSAGTPLISARNF
jgi:hypothetical protein